MFFQEIADELNRRVAALPDANARWQFINGVSKMFGGPGIRAPGRRHPAGGRPKKKNPRHR